MTNYASQHCGTAADTSVTALNPRRLPVQALVATTPTPDSTHLSNSSAFNLNALRLPATYGAALGVKKVLTNIPVGKPKRTQFFQVHTSQDMTFNAMLLEQKDTRESYLVLPDVAQQIIELVKAVQLQVAIDRQGNVFLVPIPLPGEDGNRNPWHESLAQAMERAKFKWIRIAANLGGGAYDVFEALGNLALPEWPDHRLDAMVEVAFRGKIVKDMEHPVIQSLLGKI